jgi:hypothetical protein
MERSGVKTFNECRSMVAINDGKGGFKVEALPVMVQLSSVNAIEAVDVNGDGKVDLVAGGNMFGFPPQFGRLDGSYGHVLLNDGRGNFTWVEPNRSGLNIKSEIKDIRTIKTATGRQLLITENDQRPVLFAIKK